MLRLIYCKILTYVPICIHTSNILWYLSVIWLKKRVEALINKNQSQKDHIEVLKKLGKGYGALEMSEEILERERKMRLKKTNDVRFL